MIVVKERRLINKWGKITSKTKVETSLHLETVPEGVRDVTVWVEERRME